LGKTGHYTSVVIIAIIIISIIISIIIISIIIISIIIISIIIISIIMSQTITTTITTRITTLRTEYRTVTFQKDGRGPCSWILNFLWLLIAGWHMFLTWFLAGILLCCTLIGIPCGCQAIKISFFLLFPFGKTMTYTDDGEGEGVGRCCCCCRRRSCDGVLNLLWALTIGWILALQAFVTGILLMVTIIGFPLGWQCIKLMYICLFPFGKDFIEEPVETITVVVVDNQYHLLPQHSQQQQQHHQQQQYHQHQQHAKHQCLGV
jgi:uncharacterized membrane protein YccF (DUF307 family)